MEPQQILSKLQAMEAMRQGKKVCHRYFMDHEYIFMKDGEIYSEDGVCHGAQFWHIRHQADWQTDWQIFE